MARSRSPPVRRLLTRGTAGIDDIFLSPLTTEEKRRCRCLETEGNYCSDDEDSVEEPSSSSVDDKEEHTSQSLEHVGTSPSQHAIEDYSQVDVSSSGSVELAGVPPYILVQLNEEPAQLELGTLPPRQAAPLQMGRLPAPRAQELTAAPCAEWCYQRPTVPPLRRLLASGGPAGQMLLCISVPLGSLP